ncbi:hypothetical protein OG474_29945 [Kribbella sp. NBC_01505]|uniref:hypothetical protein n=1 Tax=Kribbella sp. NBC_01505 TaxID=2903580 RepID=UPI003863A140
MTSAIATLDDLVLQSLLEEMATPRRWAAGVIRKSAPVVRCEDYSWLPVDQCAHCLGHELPDDVPVQSS